VADIQFPLYLRARAKGPENAGDGIPLLRTLLGFSAGRKPYERIEHVEIGGKRAGGKRPPPLLRAAARVPHNK